MSQRKSSAWRTLRRTARIARKAGRSLFGGRSRKSSGLSNVAMLVIVLVIVLAMVQVG